MMSLAAGVRPRRIRRSVVALAMLACAALGVSLAVAVLPQVTSNAASVPTIGCESDPVVFNTGYVQSTGAIGKDGAVEERWTAASGTGDRGVTWGNAPVPQGPLEPTYPASSVPFTNAYVGKANNAWLDSPFHKAQWVTAHYVSPASGGANQTSAWGDFYYKYTFVLDPKVDKSTFNLTMDWYADNTVRGVWVNSTLQYKATMNPYDSQGFLAGKQARTALAGFVPGATNTIVVQVGSTIDAEGFMAQVNATALCPSLTVAKAVSGARVDPADQFTVSAADSAGAPVLSATTSGSGTTASATTTVKPDTYTVSEKLAPGSVATQDQYNGVLVCANRTDSTKKVTTSGSYPSWRVVIPSGAAHDYLCTITNSAKTFTVIKTVDPPPPAIAHPGQKVTYSVVVKNTGTTPFSGVGTDVASFTDDLSRVLDDATYNGDASGGAVVNGSVLSWKGALAVGASVTITYSFVVNPLGAGDGTLVNTVTGGPSCASQCTASTSTSVQSYVVEKTASAGSAVPGGTIRYSVTVTNTSRLDYTEAAPATFTDDLTDVLKDATYNDDATGGATYSAPVLSWSGALAAQSSVTITYSVTVANPARGDRSIVNTVVSAPSGSNCFAGSTDARCTVTVAVQAGDVVWRKVDSSPGHNLLAGSAWTLTPVGGAGTPIEIDDCAVAPCTGSDRESLAGGFLLSGLVPGEYRLVETRAPIGFLLKTDPIAVTVTAGATTTLDPIVNDQVPVPILPLTGGVGADTFTLLGLGVLALTAALAVARPLAVLLRRRRRPV